LLGFLAAASGALLLAPTPSSAQMAAGVPNHGHERRVEIVNESGENLAVDWVNPRDGKPQPFRLAKPSDVLALNSFVNHTFIIRQRHSTGGDDEVGVNNNTEASSASKAEVIVTVSEKPTTQMVYVRKGLQVVEVGQPAEVVVPAVPNPEASDIVFRCRISADTAVERGDVPAEEIIRNLYDCLERETAAALERQNEELAFQHKLRTRLSSKAENYTCADSARETTEPIETREWTHKGVTRRVGILHDRPSSQIHVLHDFISAEECQAVQEAAAKTLHRGTVADGKGGSKMSENRKAWQAGVKVDWAKESQGDRIAAVKRRLFDYAQHAVGYNMTVDGQEDLMSIQYFGSEVEQGQKPDRYAPHCDGDCDGMPHKRGGRVATMVMYCDAPELGGGTNFQHSNVYVKPTVGAAAFFSYMNPETMHHETGFTTHSGCPVLKGTKRIAVQWMRIGVDSDNPWDSFDTNTISLKSKAELVDDEEGAYHSESGAAEDRKTLEELEKKERAVLASLTDDDSDEDLFDSDDFDDEGEWDDDSEDWEDDSDDDDSDDGDWDDEL